MNFRRNISDYFVNSITTTSFVLGLGTAMLVNRYMPELKDEVMNSKQADQVRDLSQKGQQMLSKRIRSLESQLSSIEHKLDSNYN